MHVQQILYCTINDEQLLTVQRALNKLGMYICWTTKPVHFKFISFFAVCPVAWSSFAYIIVLAADR